MRRATFGNGTFRTYLAGLTMSVAGGKADLAITTADFRVWTQNGHHGLRHQELSVLSYRC